MTNLRWCWNKVLSLIYYTLIHFPSFDRLFTVTQGQRLKTPKFDYQLSHQFRWSTAHLHILSQISIACLICLSRLLSTDLRQFKILHYTVHCHTNGHEDFNLSTHCHLHAATRRAHIHCLLYDIQGGRYIWVYVHP